MPIYRTVHIIIEEDLDGGQSKVLLQTGSEDPADTGIRAKSAVEAVKIVADKLGGKA